MFSGTGTVVATQVTFQTGAVQRFGISHTAKAFASLGRRDSVGTCTVEWGDGEICQLTISTSLVDSDLVIELTRHGVRRFTEREAREAFQCFAADLGVVSLRFRAKQPDGTSLWLMFSYSRDVLSDVITVTESPPLVVWLRNSVSRKSSNHLARRIMRLLHRN